MGSPHAKTKTVSLEQFKQQMSFKWLYLFDDGLVLLLLDAVEQLLADGGVEEVSDAAHHLRHDVDVRVAWKIIETPLV